MTPAEDSPSGPRSADLFFVRSLYTQYAGPLLAVVVRLTGGDRHWAEDVVQETLLRAWRHADRLQPERGSLMPWLTTVARRIVRNDRRHRSVRPKEVDDTHIALVGVPDETEQTLHRMILRDAIATLSPAHRSVIVQMYLQGRTIDEMARTMGVPPGTVKSRLYYATRALRTVLQSRGVAYSRRGAR